MPESAVLEVWVTPRAAGDELAGWQGAALRVRLRAPPLDGRANAALCQFLAQALGVPASSIALLSGAAGRRKRLRIDGLEEAEVRRRLSWPGGASA